MTTVNKMNIPPPERARAMSRTRATIKLATMSPDTANQLHRSSLTIESSLQEHLKPVVQNSVMKWKKHHQQKMMNKLTITRMKKKIERDKQYEGALSTAQKIAVDVIAREWFNDQALTIEVRCYLLESLLPIIIIGVEKLLFDVDKLKLADKNEIDWNFNPINRLAQFLMRHNPKYCNFLEQSPYVRGLRKVSAELHTHLLKVQENNVVRLKAQIAKKRKERERRDELKRKEMERRQSIIDEQFGGWCIGGENEVELSVIQKSLRTFGDIVESYPAELQAATRYTGDMEKFDDTGKTLAPAEFLKYISSYLEKMPSEVFDHFTHHLQKCSDVHKDNKAREYRRITLSHLFASCDHSGIGQLDRHRILNLFEMFWDGADETVKAHIRNPRRWPVVEVDESEAVNYTEDNDLDKGEYKTEPDEAWFPDYVNQAAREKEEEIRRLKEEEEREKEEARMEEERMLNGEAEDASLKSQGSEGIEPKSQFSEANSDGSDVKTFKSSEAVSHIKSNEEIRPKSPESTGSVAAKTPAESTVPSSTNIAAVETADGVASKSPVSQSRRGSDVANTISVVKSNVSGADSSKPPTAINSIISNKDDGSKVVSRMGSHASARTAITGVSMASKAYDTKSGQTGNVSFAPVPPLLDREKTGASLTSRCQSQMSSFDENVVNVSQFVHMIETYIGTNPTRELFVNIVDYLHNGYEETEQERMERLLKARKDVMKIKHKNRLDTLFERWDNDGSGFLDMDEVENVIMKYKNGMERQAFEKGKNSLIGSAVYQDQRLSKREFRQLVETMVNEIPGTETFDYFVDFLIVSLERSYVEKIRGEARRKWLTTIVRAAETGGARMDPVYKALFMTLYKDAEAHGGGKKISGSLSMLENTPGEKRGDVLLRYIATTPDDAEYMLGEALYKDMKGISFSAIESGKPLHVPRVCNHGNIYFWNPNRRKDERDGSFIVVPLKDRRKRVFGLLGVDTLNDPHKKSIFITHEVLFYQGIAKAFSIAFHHVDIRRKLLRITESAISWIQRRSSHVKEINIYMSEPNATDTDYLLRKMIVTDDKANATSFDVPPKLERQDNLFRDYLFKCADTSETVTADAYGQRHLAIPLRDDQGRALAVIDISIGELRRLPIHENREVQRMVKLLQQAHCELTKELNGDDDTQVLLQAENDDDTRVDVMFDRLMLMELRDNMSRLDNAAYAELRSYADPPKVIHDILKAVLSVFHIDKAEEGEFDDWNNVRHYVSSELSSKIQSYDPTREENLIPAEQVMHLLNDVPHGSVQKHASQPAEYLYNWVFVCLSLIEHTRKTRSTDAVDTIQDKPKLIEPHSSIDEELDITKKLGI